MADPATLAIGSMAGTAAGGLIQGIGAGTSADAQAQAYQYKAGVAQINKQINEQNANFAIETGDIKAQETELQGEQEIANTTVTQAASGFVVGQGTNKAVTDSQRSVIDFDKSVIQWDAGKTAWGFEAKAATDEAESNLDLMAASSQKTAGILGEIGSFVNAGTSVATKWYQGSTQGIFSSGSSNPYYAPLDSQSSN